MKRICIYPQDIMNITGCSKRHAYTLLAIIRAVNKKGKHQYVTIKEFCAHTGIDEASIEL